MADRVAAPAASATGQHIALTGATGFVGRALLPELTDANVTALCRGGAERGLGISQRVNWLPGDLSDTSACAQLVEGADVVIHLAGLTKAFDAAEFHNINATCTGRLAAQAAAAGVRHFIFLSSLAATRPEVSDYAASKASGEEQLQSQAGDMAVTVVRAPAVLGPGDDATAPLIRMLARGLAIVPGGNAHNSRFSIIDVQDLARQLARLAADDAQVIASQSRYISPYSVQSTGFDDIAETTEGITGRRVHLLSLPRLAVRLAGFLADLVARVRRKPEVFGMGKVREIYSGDWIAETSVPDPTPLEATLRSCLAARLGAKPVTESRAKS